MPGGWRGRGNWPGAGPYNHLPPWQRPGWLYGKGTCWQLYGPYSPYPVTPAIKPENEAALLAEQKAFIEEQQKTLQETLKKIQERLNELNK